jgi:hypothetical protein
MKFLNLTIGISLAIIGVVVAASMLSGLWSTFVTALTTLNNTSGIPLRALIDPTGVVPLVVMAVFVIAIIVGLFALIKGAGKNR